MTEVGPLKVLSLLLQYPEGDRLAARPALCEAAAGLDGRQGEAVRAFTRWYATAPAAELQQRYVETFDFQRRSTLHLTYHLFGDRRQRGMALLSLKQRYAAAGLPPIDDELPDYLPLVLEFADLEPDLGHEILERYRESLELLRASLHGDGSPWAALVDAVCLELPGLTRTQTARIRRRAAEGPPEEEVGLEPFGPPEVVAPAAAAGGIP